MQKSANVAVFWDYENCPAPASTSGYAIANKISAMARSFGSVKVFKAYLEISDQSRSSIRSELQSSGVSLVDCPHNGGKDVADKMILVDMLSYAIDNPAPSTILLITGDRDFAYAVSILKNRHYNVVLVKRPNTHVSLTFQACICFDWFDDVVHQAENPSSQAEQSLPYRRDREPDFHCNASAPDPSPHPATEEPIGSGTDTRESDNIVHFLRDKISGRVPPALPEHELPRQDREISSSPRHRRVPSFFNSRDSVSNAGLLQVKPHQTSPQSTQSEPPSPEDTLPDHNSPVRSRSAGGARTHTNADVISSFSSPIIWPAPVPPMTPNTMARRIVHEETDKKTIKAMRIPATPPMSVEELAGKFLKKDHISPINPSSATIAISSPSSKSSTSGTSNIETLKPAIDGSPALKPRYLKPANPTNVVNSDFWRIAPSGSLGRSAVGPPLDTPLAIPQNFVILVEALQWQRAQGVSYPYRNVIAERISKKGTTYQKAGVTTFRDYSLLAEKAGIVDMGGKGGRDWISLKPRWHSMGPVGPLAPETIVC